MKAIRTIAYHEFGRIVFSWRFLLGTFALPLVILAYGAFILGLTSLMKNTQFMQKESALAIVDESGVFAPWLKDVADGELVTYDTLPDQEGGEVTVRAYRSRELAEQDLKSRELDAFFLLPADVAVTGIGKLFLRTIDGFGLIRDESLVRLWAKKAVLDYLAVPEEIRQLASRGVTFERSYLSKKLEEPERDEAGQEAENKSEEESDSEPGLESKTKSMELSIKEKFDQFSPYMIVGLMIWILIRSASRLEKSLLEENQSRLIDILLTSVSEYSIVFGKVLSIVLVSLLQLGIWMVVALWLPALFLLRSDFSLELGLRPLALLLMLGIVILGVFFNGLLIAGLGALLTDPRDPNPSTKLLAFAQFVLILALWMILPGGSDWLWRVCSLMPFLTPFLVPIQLRSIEYSLLEGAFYLVYLSLWVFLMARLSGRLLRAGIMIRGQQMGMFRSFLEVCRLVEFKTLLRMRRPPA